MERTVLLRSRMQDYAMSLPVLGVVSLVALCLVLFVERFSQRTSARITMPNC